MARDYVDLIGLTGGYDYDALLEQVQNDEALKMQYDYMMSVYSKVVLEVLIEPDDGKCKMFSREYYSNMVSKMSGNKK